MMLANPIKRIISFFYKQKEDLSKIKKQNLELEWAQVYHDSIRGVSFLENLPLYIGRWAGNYTFFYILNRVLADYMPKRIIELGLGESTKIISEYLKNYLTESSHLVIEQNQDWLNHFKSRFPLSKNTDVAILAQKTVIFEGKEVNIYDGIDRFCENKYDLYVIDGPIGSKSRSRIDILNFMKNVEDLDEFVIIMDDCHRNGERKTLHDIETILKEKNITYKVKIFNGNKDVGIVATEKYKWLVSI